MFSLLILIYVHTCIKHYTNSINLLECKLRWCNNDFIHKLCIVVITINSINKLNPIYRTVSFDKKPQYY